MRTPYLADGALRRVADGRLRPVEGKLTFWGGASCQAFVNEPYKLRRAVKDVGSVERRFEIIRCVVNQSRRAEAYFIRTATNRPFIHQKFDDEGKNYEWCARLIRWMAILYDSQVTHERVLEDAPLFFVDLDRGVRGMMDCLCDADLARVGYERPKFRAARKAPLDTLGILDGSVEDPNKRMSASERPDEARDGERGRARAPRGVLYLCDNAVDARPRRCPRARFDEVEASIKRGRAEGSGGRNSRPRTGATRSRRRPRLIIMTPKLSVSRADELLVELVKARAASSITAWSTPNKIELKARTFMCLV